MSTNEERKFKKVQVISQKLTKEDDSVKIEKLCETMQIPIEYEADKQDRFYRPPMLRNVRIDDCFHVIAQGRFADIIAARVDGRPVVAKRYKLASLDETINGYSRLREEIEARRIHRHENIVKFYEYFVETSSTDPRLPTHIWVVVERMEQSLEEYLKHGKYELVVTRQLVQSFLIQTLAALDYLHGQGIVHRHLSPRSIGINEAAFKIKLLDFGTPCPASHGQQDEPTCQSPKGYLPLETIMGIRFDAKADIWALAVVVFELLGVKLFSPIYSDQEAQDEILEILGVPKDKYLSTFGSLVDHPPVPGKLSSILDSLCERLIDCHDNSKVDDFRVLIEWMLAVDPSLRPAAKECLGAKFLFPVNKLYSPEISTEERNFRDRFEVIEELIARNDRYGRSFDSLSYWLRIDSWDLGFGYSSDEAENNVVTDHESENPIETENSDFDLEDLVSISDRPIEAVFHMPIDSNNLDLDLGDLIIPAGDVYFTGEPEELISFSAQRPSNT